MTGRVRFYRSQTGLEFGFLVVRVGFWPNLIDFEWRRRWGRQCLAYRHPFCRAGFYCTACVLGPEVSRREFLVLPGRGWVRWCSRGSVWTRWLPSWRGCRGTSRPLPLPPASSPQVTYTLHYSISNLLCNKIYTAPVFSPICLQSSK